MQVVLRTARETWPMCGTRCLEWLVSGVTPRSSLYVLAFCVIGRCSERSAHAMGLPWPIGVTTSRCLTGPAKNKAAKGR